MDLKNALQRAAKFALKDKDDEASVLNHILLVPHTFDEPVQFFEAKKGEPALAIPKKLGYVAASNGAVTVVIYLDPDVYVPHLTIDAEAAAKAATAFKREQFFIERCGEYQVVMRGLSGGQYHVAAGYASAFPEVPPGPPQLFPFQKWPDVLRLLHVTKKTEKSRPDLVYLHAYAGAVEGSDHMRIARVPVTLPIPDGRLIHSGVFAHWPRKAECVATAVHGDRLFVSIDGQELRVCEAKPDKDFFDLRSKLPEDFYGTVVEVPRLKLMQAVKWGTIASPTDSVELSFARGSVEVCGLGDSLQPESRHVVEARGASAPVRLVMRGRLLWDSLSVLDDDEVDVGYSAAEQPLRLEAPGGYIEAIWPLRPVGGKA